MNKRSAEHNDNKIEKKVKQKKTFNKIMNIINEETHNDFS